MPSNLTRRVVFKDRPGQVRMLPTWKRVFQLLAKQTIAKKKLRSKELRLQQQAKLLKARSRLLATRKIRIAKLEETIREQKTMMQRLQGRVQQCYIDTAYWRTRNDRLMSDNAHLSVELRTKKHQLNEICGHLGFIENQFRGFLF